MKPMKLKHIKLQNTIKKIIEESPDISDMRLVLEIWQKEGLLLTDTQLGFIEMCYSPDSITRMKRYVRKKDGRYKRTIQDITNSIIIPKV